MSSVYKNIVIFGSHGKIGQQLVRLISQPTSSYRATALVRNSDQADQILKISSNSSNITTKEFTFDNASVEEISDVIRGHDVVVFTAGSGGKALLLVDLDGAVKTFEATVKANVRRYVLISAIHADKRETFSKSGLRDYYIAKHYADRILVNEFKDDLDYTILRPTSLTDDEPTGKIRQISAGDELGTVTRADVAKVIYDTIGDEKTFGKGIDFGNESS
jgi:uncharacterized protein YbjT (DUF2867 family)